MTDYHAHPRATDDRLDAALDAVAKTGMKNLELEVTLAAAKHAFKLMEGLILSMALGIPREEMTNDEQYILDFILNGKQ